MTARDLPQLVDVPAWWTADLLLTGEEIDELAAQYQRDAIAGATDEDPQVDAAGTYTN